MPNSLQFATRILLVSFFLVMAGCGGGGNGNSSTGPHFSLTPTSIPISINDKLVTVTVTQNTGAVAFATRLKNFLAKTWDNIIPSALAAQLTPTLSTQATAKIVAGQAVLVDPVYTAEVTYPDPNNPGHTITRKVNVTCDTASIQTTVHVNKAWALNLTSGDVLVNMDYPSSVDAEYDPNTNTFSACHFEYSSGYFIVFGDSSVSGLVDPALGAKPAPQGCNMMTDLEAMRVIAAGDPTRNPTGVPLLNSLHSATMVTSSGATIGPLCGSLRALNYSAANTASFTPLTFSTTIQTYNQSIAVDASQRVYAVGIDMNYGNMAIDPACPVATMKIGDTSSTCMGVPNLSNFVSYPVPASQVQAAGMYGPYIIKSANATIFIDKNGLPLLSLQPFSGCNIGGCLNVQKPTLFSIDPALATISQLATPALDASGFPYAISGNMTPIGLSNDYLMYSNAGPGNGVLVNVATGAVIYTCSNNILGQEFGCNAADAFGDYVYGFVGCAISGAAPDTCINNPSFNRVNTKTGVVEHWDLKSMGYLALNSMSNASNTMSLPVRPVFFTDQVVFLACPTPNLACAAPNWLSLDFATGQITQVTSGGITFDMLPTLVGTTLWW